MAIKIKLEGFEELFEKIQKAGGSVDEVCESTMRESAQIMETELKSQMQSADVPSDLIERMPAYEFNKEGNNYSAKVGYKGTSYDSNNLSDYFKAIFLNYGTPHRSEHGKVAARGFVAKAKKKAKPIIKKQQQKALDKILNDLKG